MIDALFNGVGRRLALEVSKGNMTLEQLDQPPPGHESVEQSRTASRSPCDSRNSKQQVPYYNLASEAIWTYPRPTMEYPPAKPYRNLAREWITANPKEWERMNGREPVSVQVTDPKDLPPLPHGVTPPQPDGPLTLDDECPL